MMPGMHNNQFMMSPHQMQSSPINQNMPSATQDSNGLGGFDDFCNQDFGNVAFESLLHGGEPAGTRISNEVFRSETPSVPQESQQMSIDPQLETYTSIKAEPCQSLPFPIRDAGFASEPAAVSSPMQESMDDTPIDPVPVTIEVTGPAPSNPPIEAVHQPLAIQTTLPLKQENDVNCIFICDWWQKLRYRVKFSITTDTTMVYLKSVLIATPRRTTQEDLPEAYRNTWWKTFGPDGTW
jgi:hypothetical protein